MEIFLTHSFCVAFDNRILFVRGEMPSSPKPFRRIRGGEIQIQDLRVCES
jgi:hypothetical protein